MSASTLPVNVGYYADALAVPAVRYALGRRSHVVATVAQAAAGLLPHMQTKLLVALERDLRDALAAGRAGDECDATEWQRLHGRVIRALADRQEGIR